MTLVVVNFTDFGAGPRVDLGTGNSLWVGQDGLIVATDFANAVVGTGSGQTVTVQGAVVSDFGAISLGQTSADTNNRVIVTATGVVSSQFNAIQMNGTGSTLTNFGQVNGTVVFNGGGSITSKVLNYGDMTGTDFCAVYSGPGTFVLHNSGLMEATNGVVQINSSFGIGIAQIRNSGTMIGNVILGNGADLFDGRGGTVEGTVQGRGGDDSFILGLSAEIIDGGTGNDILDLRYTQAVQVYLDGSGPNSGVAAGDTYISIEIVLGSATGADRLFGSAAANVLRGLGGIDSLSGGAGGDILAGGVGKDVLNGGQGNDFFQFQALAEAGDVITDFSNIALNDDRVRFLGAAFGGLAIGTLAASQFVTAANNLALDANDRFIFRTTDTTLWFDGNGNVAGGLTLIADMQAGVVLTASDILVF